MTTVRWGSPPGVSAITFTLCPSVSRTSVLTWATVPGSLRSTPTAKDVPTPGMWTPSAPSGRLLGTAVRPGWPSLNRMIADAPAAWAMAAFVTYGHVPRWIRAMLPATNPAKSSTSHALVDPLGAGVGGRTRSTPCTAAVTSPVPVKLTKSPSKAGREPGTNTCGSGAVSSSTGGEPSVNSSTKVNSSRLTSYPAAVAFWTM